MLEPLAGLSGPFLTVSIDATRTDPSAEHEVALRWRALFERVPAGTFPAEVLGDVAAHAVAVTGSAGPATRFLVATAAGLVIDLVLPGRPVRDEAVFGPAPHLLPVLRAVRLRVPYLLVRLDRAGADIDSVPLFGVGVEHVEVQARTTNCIG